MAKNNLSMCGAGEGGALFKFIGFNPLLKEFRVGTQAIAGTESRNNGGEAC